MTKHKFMGKWQTPEQIENWILAHPIKFGGGGGSNAQQQAAEQSGQQLSNTYNEQAQQAQQQLLPFYQAEITDPTGYGQQTINEMNTASGEAVSGSEGGAIQQAKLNASRSGNPASQSAIIDEATRQGTSASAKSALDVALLNAQLKQAQQQAGIQGLQGQEATDVQAQLGNLGIAGNVANSMAQANTASQGNIFSLFCWCAAKTFNGWEDGRTYLVRSYLLTRKSWMGRKLVCAYKKHGKKASESRLAMFFIRPFIRLALRAAQEN